MNFLNGIKSDILKLNRYAIIFGIFAIWNVIGFLPPIPASFYYALLSVTFVYCIVNSRKMDLSVLTLLIYIPINILITNPNPIFKSWDRYVLFALLLGCVSLLFQSEKFFRFRGSVLVILLNICIFLGAASALCFYLGINLMQVSLTNYQNHIGIFSGLTRHSMLLGPIAGFGTLYCYFKFTREKNKVYLILMILCILSILFSASRAALAGTVVGFIVLVYKQQKNMGKFVRTIMMILVVGCATFPLWTKNLTYIISKNNGQTTEISYNSREDKWANRISEFKEDPLFGIGFAAVSTDYERDYDTNSGIVETGSSWLAVFSMTGIIGAVIVLSIIFRSFIGVWLCKSNLAPLLCGLLSFFFINMLAEGFIFSGGSFLCLMFWLFIGCANDLKYYNPRNSF